AAAAIAAARREQPAERKHRRERCAQRERSHAREPSGDCGIQAHTFQVQRTSYAATQRALFGGKIDRASRCFALVHRQYSGRVIPFTYRAVLPNTTQLIVQQPWSDRTRRTLRRR